MGTYRVPRNTKGESRILLIFSTKALIYTVIGLALGYFINIGLEFIGIETVGILIMVILALIGFTIGTLKIPEIGALPITKQIAGEKLDEVIVRYFKFKQNSQKIYISEKNIKNKKDNKKKEEHKNDK